MNINLTPIPVTIAPVEDTTLVQLTITEAAGAEISASTEKAEHEHNHIRIGVTGSGCNGFAYVLEYVNSISQAEDYEFNSNGIVVVVDKRSYPYVKGMEIDFVKEGFKQGFVFNNPNQTSSCGCGESFSV